MAWTTGRIHWSGCTTIHALIGWDAVGEVEFTDIDSIGPNPHGITEGSGDPPNDISGLPQGWYRVSLSTDYGGAIDAGLGGSVAGGSVNGKWWEGDHTTVIYIDDPDEDVQLDFYTSDGLGDTGAGPYEATFEICPTTPIQGSYSLATNDPTTFNGGVGITDLTFNAGSEVSTDLAVIDYTSGTDIEVLQDIRVHAGGTVTMTWSPGVSGTHSIILRAYDASDTLVASPSASAAGSAGTLTLTTPADFRVPAGGHLDVRVTNTSSSDTSGVLSMDLDWTLD